MSTHHCCTCGYQTCNHGNCPECRPCQHCNGGDRFNKYFPEDDRPEPDPRDHAGDILDEEDTRPEPFPHSDSGSGLPF